MSELQLVALPTGKTHISYSELRDWMECSYRHKLKFVSKIDLGKPGPMMDFGTAVHAACEKYLRTREMDPQLAKTRLNELWEKNSHIESYKPAALGHFQDEIRPILDDIPKFLEREFGAWEFIDAEHALYEEIVGHSQAFKGFIDGIIKTRAKRGNKDVYWLIDWKTTSSFWSATKKQDKKVTYQLALYKNFWSQKMNVDFKSIQCAFVLLKRSAKPGNHCELVKVSVGDVTREKAVKTVCNMLASVKRGVAIKNRDSCKYCDYNGTEHCK